LVFAKWVVLAVVVAPALDAELAPEFETAGADAPAFVELLLPQPARPATPGMQSPQATLQDVAACDGTPCPSGDGNIRSRR
jgi:hypothetical protein